jgi:predicted Zn-dependent protease
MLLSLPLLLLAILAGCTSVQRVQTETALARSLVSDEQMAQVGEQIHDQLESQGIRYVKDATVVQYVNGIASKIFGLARRDRPGIEYHVHVIDDRRTVNAFATPGGHIYVYSGLLLATQTEAELAGVLAHEVGHVTGRHIERAMVNAYGVETVAAVALGQNPSAAKQAAAGLVATGILRAHSRSEESEADQYSARYLSQLNYDPKAMISFLQKLQAKETSGGPGWFRTHPVTSERIQDLNSYIAQNALRGTVVGAERHRAIQRELA